MLLPDDLARIADQITVYDLGQPIAVGIPKMPAHTPFLFTLTRRHGDFVRAGGCTAANDLMVISGHTGTHIDAPGHFAENMKLSGGVDAAGAQRDGRLHSHGIDAVPPIVRRGVLLDVPAFRGVDRLAAAEPLGAAELAAVARHQSTPIAPGDAVLIRTGWIQHWDNPEVFIGEYADGAPGPDASAAEWLVEQRISVTGCDTAAYEVYAPGQSGLPCHQILLARRGIPILEMLNLEALSTHRAYTFVFVCLPLRIVGGTGSPVRPVALV